MKLLLMFCVDASLQFENFLQRLATMLRVLIATAFLFSVASRYVDSLRNGRVIVDVHNGCVFSAMVLHMTLLCAVLTAFLIQLGFQACLDRGHVRWSKRAQLLVQRKHANQRNDI